MITIQRSFSNETESKFQDVSSFHVVAEITSQFMTISWKILGTNYSLDIFFPLQTRILVWNKHGFANV